MIDITEELEDYLCCHSDPEPELLKQLRRETYVHFLNPRMASGHLQGRLLVMLTRMIRPRRVLELGAFTGYSTLCLAEGAGEGAEVHSIERNDELADHLGKWFARSPYGHLIYMHYGEAEQLIPKLDGTFDMVFLDVDKRQYKICYELSLQKMAPGSFLLADNTLWNGKMLHDIQRNDCQALAISDFNDYLAADFRVEKVMLPLRDGLTLVRKK